MTIYNDILMDHYRSPRHFGCKDFDSDKMSLVHNPSCGDKIILKIKIDKDKITDICFDGHGCALSIASASILCDSLIGKSLNEAKMISSEAVVKMLEIDISPVRMKCALMALKALEEALSST